MNADGKDDLNECKQKESLTFRISSSTTCT